MVDGFEGDKNADPFAVTIWGEAADDPVPYSAADIVSTRARTAASVQWQDIPQWTLEEEDLPGGEHQRTPDLMAIVQEVVDRDGWQEGNAMAFILAGTGQRTAESFDGDSALAPALVVRFVGEQSTPSSHRVRLTWAPGDDPATTMNVVWDQVRGSGAQVHYDAYDPLEGCPRALARYGLTQAPQRTAVYRGMNNHFAKLSALAPNTAYRFVIADATGAVTDCMWFRTAPNTPQAFTYITGGDTKSSGNALQAGRWSNRMVAKLRPLFVLFTGDFNSGDGTSDARWQQWLSDWFEGTRSGDGRMYPIIAVHGNHEDGDLEMLHNLFDSGNADPEQPADYSYGSWTIGGSLLHVINLNSQLYLNGLQGAHDQQLAWLGADLAAHATDTFKIAGYHKPIRPHTSTKAENDHELAWADLFDTYGLTIANESDTHNHKLTFPLRRSDEPGNDMGFVRDDDNGVLYVGEGSWGATPRADNDDKSWTLDSASINQIKWNHVYPAGAEPARLEVRTVVTARYEDGQLVNYVDGVGEVDDSDPFAPPSGITLHAAPFYGEVVSMPFQTLSGEPPSAPAGLIGEATSYTDITIAWTNTEDPANVGNITVERRIGAAGSWETVGGGLDPATTRFSQSELRDGTDYTYRVRANNVFGSSDWSNELLVSTPVDNRLKLTLSEGSDGYAGSRVIAIASASPDAAFAAAELSFDQDTSDYGGPGVAHGLIGFDDLLSRLPAGTVVTAAELRFRITSSSNGPVGLYRMLQPWDAGSSWSSFGGDGIQADGIEAVASADELKINLRGNTFTTYDVTASVRAWADGAANRGWLILNESGDGWDIATELHTDMELRPRLTVFYSHLGDADGNGVVARDDMTAMREHLRQPASSCPACDLNGDGVISIRDARLLILELRR
jgi:hypothetical protein